MLQHIAIVSLGGAIGATLRFAVGQLLDSTDFPWSTFMVNALGSVVLGAITVYAINRGSSEELMLFFSTGLLGAFTTMSTFSGWATPRDIQKQEFSSNKRKEPLWVVVAA